jgi:hypothetical protein
VIETFGGWIDFCKLWNNGVPFLNSSGIKSRYERLLSVLLAFSSGEPAMMLIAIGLYTEKPEER